MSDVNISKYRAQVIRQGSTPASPGFAVSEGQNPVDPSGNPQTHLPVTIGTTTTGLSITESQVLSGAGLVSQYIRGDGSLADFPASTGGGSSVSYYLNGSVSQGTIGGVAYKQLNRTPVFGAGTDFTINADGYIASFITDASDPNKLLIPAGNWNFETYFSASSNGGSPSFYVELYKYDGTTFTLIATSSSAPELIAFGTSLNPYYSTLAVPQTTLALTDRLAIRYYVTHSGRTITLHTEDNHLCQIITTFTTGLTALNGLTAQVQNFAVGTSGTDFAIASATATHTFNLPTASATNRGALSSTDWSTFNAKQQAITLTTTGTSGASTLVGATLNIPSYTDQFVGTVTSVAATAGTGISVSGSPITTSGTLTITNTAPDQVVALTPSTGIAISGTYPNFTITNTSPSSGGTVTSVTGTSPIVSSGGTTPAISIPVATTSVNGYLSSTDWTTFNNKQGTITLTTTGTSGAATFSSNTLNIPQYQSVITNPVTGTGTTNYLPKFTGASTIGNSAFYDGGGFGGFNSTGLGVRTFVINAASGRPLVFEMIEFANIHSVYVRPNNSGFNLISSNYISGGVYLPLSLSGRENNADLVLQTGGNVTIGTTTDAGYKLDVNGTGRFSGNVRIDGTSNGYLTLNATSTGGNESGIFFQVGGGNKWENYTANNDTALNWYSYANSTIVFKLASTGAATFASNVNVGGTSANTDFRIYRTVDSSVFFSVSAPGGTPNTSILGINGTDVLALNASGNVGIGTTSPNRKLEVITGNGTTNGIRLTYASGVATEGMDITYLNTGNTTTSFDSLYNSNSSIMQFRMKTAGTAVTAMTILGSGNVLIGTTTSALDSDVKLQVTQGASGVSSFSANADDIILQNNGSVGITFATPNTNRATIAFADPQNSEAGYIFYDHANDYMSFGTAATEKIAIASNGTVTIQKEFWVKEKTVLAYNSGNVLIGTTTDTGDKLRVNGTTFTNEIMTWNPQNDNRSAIAWRLGAATIGTDILNRRLRVNVGGVEYYIGAVEV